jgi:cytoskeletal protein RodZ
MKRYVTFLCIITMLAVGAVCAACAGQKTATPPPEETPEAVATATKRPTREPPTRAPTSTQTPTSTATPTRTPRPTATPTLTRTPIPTSTRYVRATATPLATPTEAPAGAPAGAPVRPASQVPAPTPTPVMFVLEDKDPGPPFTITTSANRALPDSKYLVTGLVRNDAAETYEAIGVNVTFWDDEGFRQGPLNARVPCTLLAP